MSYADTFSYFMTLIAITLAPRPCRSDGDLPTF